MVNLIDTINSTVSNTVGQPGANYGIKTRTPVIPAQTTPGPMSTNTTSTSTPFIAPLASNVAPTVKSSVAPAPLAAPIVTKSVTADTLKTTTPVTLPEPIPTTPPTPITLPEVTNPLDAERARLKAEQTTQESGITKLLQEMGGIQGKEATYATELGADTAQKEYDRLSSDLAAEQLSLRRQEEDIRRNFGGTTAGASAAISAVQRDSLSKQADIAILANAAKGRFDTAMDIAKRKVESALQPLKAELDAKKFIFDNNKEVFSKAQLSKLEGFIKQDDLKIKREEDRLTKGNEMIINALSQGAPASSTSKAKDLLAKGAGILEVANSLGKYAGDYLGNEIKRSTISKNYADANKTMQELKGLTIDTSTLPNTTNGFITKLAASAKNSKDLDASERQSLAKARTVIGQLDSLQTNISKQNGTGFIKGKVANLFEKFGANADVGTINAQLQAIVPNLARGTYGEVGVLTDNDIANYRKTLPRLDRPQDQNDAVMALTLKTVLNSMENTLSGAANSGINVSGWTQDYLKIKNQINTIEDRIGVAKEAVNSIVSQDPKLLPAVKEMYQNGLGDREILEALNAD